MPTNHNTFNLEIDEVLAKKFSEILSEESLMNAGNVGHQANNINNGTEENLDF
ncbi:hypothetical protein [Glaciimonas immobilis]|uniref:Uncharacterized protein n=1 Tax=Glaciimonas immobilis TaxID=728004 RepID=A0A840RR37_9BURK|nr:hypothetical protein [Glaciimonas immobilis]KAF3996846.1 hypothetical protein HAV38_16810 [Glaciimonas immobilis]MBB5199602.1 hypothetical protein [Glaciimonas immobilis]